jgi:hypothetical protein
VSVPTNTSDTQDRPAIARTVTLKDYDPDGKDIERENFDLIAKVIWLIETGPGWSEDNTFTFPDGETWADIRNDDG